MLYAKKKDYSESSGVRIIGGGTKRVLYTNEENKISELAPILCDFVHRRYSADFFMPEIRIFYGDSTIGGFDYMKAFYMFANHDKGVLTPEESSLTFIPENFDNCDVAGLFAHEVGHVLFHQMNETFFEKVAYQRHDREDLGCMNEGIADYFKYDFLRHAGRSGVNLKKIVRHLSKLF